RIGLRLRRRYLFADALECLREERLGSSQLGSCNRRTLDALPCPLPKNIAGENDASHHEQEESRKNRVFTHRRTLTILRITKWPATNAIAQIYTRFLLSGVASRMSR